MVKNLPFDLCNHRPQYGLTLSVWFILVPPSANWRLLWVEDLLDYWRWRFSWTHQFFSLPYLGVYPSSGFGARNIAGVHMLLGDAVRC